MDITYFVSLFLSGLTRGSIYALLALGYTMVYGIIKLINFAHGDVYMIGAFTALIVASVLAMTARHSSRLRSWSTDARNASTLPSFFFVLSSVI